MTVRLAITTGALCRAVSCADSTSGGSNAAHAKILVKARFVGVT
jgi:hypothetical protein